MGRACCAVSETGLGMSFLLFLAYILLLKIRGLVTRNSFVAALSRFNG